MPTFAIPNEKTTFGKQNNCWVRITVSTQDSQSCNMGSIPVPSTKSESWSVGRLFFFISYLILAFCCGHLDFNSYICQVLSGTIFLLIETLINYE